MGQVTSMPSIFNSPPQSSGSGMSMGAAMAISAVGNAYISHEQGKMQAESYRHDGAMQKLSYEHNAAMSEIYADQIRSNTKAKISIRRKELNKNLAMQNLMAGVSGTVAKVAITKGSMEEFNFDTMIIRLTGEGSEAQARGKASEYLTSGMLAESGARTAGRIAQSSANIQAGLGLVDSFIKYKQIG